jgi:outer membrane protein
MKSRLLIGWPGLMLLAVLLTVSPGVAELPVYRIGIVIDGPLGPPSRERVRGLLQKELGELIRGDFEVQLPEDKTVMVDGTAAGVRQALERLLEDPEVDLVIAAGPIASDQAARRGPLPKPVIAPLVINPSVQGIPLKGQVSGVKNLSYITFPSDVQKDLEVCREIVPFDKAALLFSRSIGEAIPDLWNHYLKQGEEAGIEGVRIPVEDTAEAVLAALPEDVEAVFVALPLKLPPKELERLAQGLIERGLPSFSALGESQVEAGLLVGLHLESDIPRLARRVALNIQRILLGEEPGALPVVFTRSERLTINMATARAIGIYPKWSVMTEARLINQKRKKAGRSLNLVSAVQQALDVNLELLASAHQVEAGAQEVRQARAHLLPQVDIDGTGVAVDQDIASVIQPERNLTGSATLSQLIYSEAALANLSIQGHLHSGRQLQRAQLRLDIIHRAAAGYLNVLRAKTFEEVQKQNLRLTRSNLELARVRQTIGMSGPAEVLRWESQIATARKNVISANARRNLAEIELNRLLHRPLEESFLTAEIGLHDEALITHEKRFILYIEDKSQFGLFREFMVEDGLASSVELQQLDAAIAAQERALNSARRAFWSPTLAFQGDLKSEFADGGAASEMPLDETNWTVGLNLSLPLYSGGGKFASSKKADAELRLLRLQRQALAERIEQRIRSALHLAGASYAGIGLSGDAAVAAYKNLELVKDAYGRGAVSILALLDAQNAAILAEEGADNAVYDFLVDLMEVERSIGKYYFFATQEYRDQWFGRLEAFFEKARTEQ